MWTERWRTKGFQQNLPKPADLHCKRYAAVGQPEYVALPGILFRHPNEDLRQPSFAPIYRDDA